MDNSIKLSVTILGIPGRTRKYSGVKKVQIKRKNKNGKEFTFVRKYKDYEYPTISKHYNMTKDAYNYMTSDEVPEWFNGKWKKLSKEEKIRQHLTRTMLMDGGTSFVFDILDD